MARKPAESPDVASERSASHRALAHTADRLVLLIVHLLDAGPARNSALMRAIDDVSQPTLTRALRHMETVGLLTRTSYPEVPPRVEYELTERGRSLGVPVAALAEWTLANLDAFEHPADPDDY